MSENSPLVEEVIVARHRHPWTLEEKGIIAFLLLIPVTLTIIHVVTGSLNMVLLAGVAVVSLVGAAGLYYLGWSRKKTSELVATLRGTKLTVVGSKLAHTNSIDLLTVESIHSEVVGVNPTFLLSSEEKIARVPFRVAKQAPLKEALLAVFASAKIDKTAEDLAKELEKS